MRRDTCECSLSRASHPIELKSLHPTVIIRSLERRSFFARKFASGHSSFPRCCGLFVREKLACCPSFLSRKEVSWRRLLAQTSLDTVQVFGVCRVVSVCKFCSCSRPVRGRMEFSTVLFVQFCTPVVLNLFDVCSSLLMTSLVFRSSKPSTLGGYLAV